MDFIYFHGSTNLISLSFGNKLEKENICEKDKMIKHLKSESALCTFNELHNRQTEVFF